MVLPDPKKLEPLSMKKILLLGSLLVALVTSPVAFAGDEAPLDFVKTRQTELAQLVKKGNAPDSKKKIENVFDAILDYDAFARDSLRENWDARTDAERREFQDVLKQLVRRAYRRNLDRTLDYDVTFQGVAPQDQSFVVRTVAQNRKNAREEPISIDYTLHKVGGDWRIHDIVTEGSSLIANYHQQFSRIIKKDGFPELMRRMKARLAKGSENT
jgi:phospholipid transport system substrate-binding protein